MFEAWYSPWKTLSVYGLQRNEVMMLVLQR